ncbi:MAG: T9SS type A sorting domain-containing protein [Bacteroidota bacterium]
MKKQLALLLLLISASPVFSQTIKVLFDSRHAQMAANADWIVDSDTYNIGTGTGGVMVTGAGNEANPQRYPTPAQSGITSTTSETYWKGSNSAWGVALAKRGYIIETLPYNGSITYGVTTNAQDLANYKVFICVEPNIRFTTSEKQAILQFVQNGGGLFMVGNHNGSDRNNDTYDASMIWNDLMTNNGTVNNPFGIAFDQLNFSETTTNFAALTNSTILSGTYGNPTRMKFSSGNSMTINRTANPNVVALVYRTGFSRTGTTGVMMCTSRYGNGKVVSLGDSSPPDDGTGDTNDALFNGWTGDVSGDHQRIIMNASVWLTNTSINRMENPSNAADAFEIFPNPANTQATISFLAQNEGNYTIELYDLVGKKVLTQSVNAAQGHNMESIDLSSAPKGIYLVQLTGNGTRSVSKLVVSDKQ